MIFIKYSCPCCGYKTLNDKPPGTYEICNICFWEDDPVQFDDPDYEGGANQLSLRKAQENYALFGVSEESCINFVRNKNECDVKDSKLKPL